MVFAALFLILAVVAFRLVTGLTGEAGMLSNFSPMAAVFLCGAAFLPRKYALAVPMAAVLVTDVILNLHHGMAPVSSWMLFTYAAYVAIFFIGFQLRSPEKRGPYQWKLFGGAIAGSVIFYLLANTGAWLATPAYAKTIAGWWQSQTVGLPGFPASIVFLRSSLVGDLFFTGMFVCCFAIARQSTAKSPAGEPLASH